MLQDLIVRRLESRIDAGAMSAAAVWIERRGEVLLDWAGGRHGFEPDAGLVSTASVFLIASLTKPMTCCAVAKLLEAGALDLDEPVAAHLPEFGQHGKAAVTLRHCCTHTSGLPDMLPENLALRRAQAPIDRFVAGACHAQLRFPPGTDVRYQSVGMLMLAAVAERVTGRRFRDLLADTIFQPAGMASSHLGWRADFANRSVQARVADPAGTASWNHNSPYWRDFGAPWGGAHATAADIARLLRVMLHGGQGAEGTRVLAPGAVRVLLADHIAALPDLPAAVRRREGWGLGWRLQRLGAGGWLGSAVPPGAFGHAGITGTVAWADPAREVICVVLTNGGLAEEGGTLKACGNIVAAALCAAPAG